jgi:hypothetical protein
MVITEAGQTRCPSYQKFHILVWHYARLSNNVSSKTPLTKPRLADSGCLVTIAGNKKKKSKPFENNAIIRSGFLGLGAVVKISQL